MKVIDSPMPPTATPPIKDVGTGEVFRFVSDPTEGTFMRVLVPMVSTRVSYVDLANGVVRYTVGTDRVIILQAEVMVT